ncbi:hypothetical protein [Pseudoduganella albidiflava]|nr:hypothetical protein [Pseudoduganella albidiflava]QBI04137.1 hypothetical protein EYF70_27450 [Pseudoduganella albidiflava]
MTAILPLDEHGQQKTWLLTGWEEGKPDGVGGVGAQSSTTQNALSLVVATWERACKPFTATVWRRKREAAPERQ